MSYIQHQFIQLTKIEHMNNLLWINFEELIYNTYVSHVRPVNYFKHCWGKHCATFLIENTSNCESDKINWFFFHQNIELENKPCWKRFTSTCIVCKYTINSKWYCFGQKQYFQVLKNTIALSKTQYFKYENTFFHDRWRYGKLNIQLVQTTYLDSTKPSKLLKLIWLGIKIITNLLKNGCWTTIHCKVYNEKPSRSVHVKYISRYTYTISSIFICSVFL